MLIFDTRYFSTFVDQTGSEYDQWNPVIYLSSNVYLVNPVPERFPVLWTVSLRKHLKTQQKHYDIGPWNQNC